MPQNHITTFHRLLGVTLLVATTNNFVWFALTYWAYLTTQSVISTSIVAGAWLVVMALSNLWFGSIVDHHKKKHAMVGSSLVTGMFFAIGLTIFTLSPAEAFTSVSHPIFWLFLMVLLCGVIVGSIYHIAIPTLVAVLVPEDRRDRANGLFGTVMGVSFAITSVASGLVLAYGGMFSVLVVAVVCTVVAGVVLLALPIPEPERSAAADEARRSNSLSKLDLRGTIAVMRSVPGLFPLVFLTTFNNFLGGVFMALMDAYGLTLVSVQVWGLLWGVLSFGFILGGVVIAKKGLGVNPIRTLFRVNLTLWTVCIFFTMQPSIVLLAVGAFLWICLVPFIEATEQTIFQKVVPPERLGRVFGFAHSLEQGASPITAFMIGPIAQFFFIPFMTTGPGVKLIGNWFGVGPGRGMALVFITAGVIGLIVTLFAMRAKAYTRLAQRYQAPPAHAKH